METTSASKSLSRDKPSCIKKMKYFQAEISYPTFWTKYKSPSRAKTKIRE